MPNSVHDNLFSVRDKVVLLTGAAGGIGRAILKGFLERGATVIGTIRSETDWQGLDELYKNTFYPYACELSDKERLAELVDYVESFPRGCDVLINNAATSHYDENIYSMEILKKVMEIDFEAPYFLCGQLAPKMAKRNSGSIINITTINSESAWPGNPSYATAKSALRALTKSIARDYGEFGVRANNICPGYIHTRMTNKSFTTPELYEQRLKHTILNRWGKPEDITGPCLFLASNASSYITAEDLHVDGGWLAKGM